VFGGVGGYVGGEMGGWGVNREQLGKVCLSTANSIAGAMAGEGVVFVCVGGGVCV
jgi:hypothetical protein